MYIYQTVNEYAFVDAFDEVGRSDNFTRQARRELFEYYSELAESTGEPVEFDVIAICCDWGEYTAEELVAEYGDPDELDDEGDYFYSLLEDLRDDTSVIEVEQYESDSTYLVQVF